MDERASVLNALQSTISERKGDDPAKSYTASLFAKGLPRMTAKITEEAGEVVEAALEQPFDRDHFIHEVADLVYHVFVTMSAHNVALHDVENELARRFGTSGLVEKANRTS